jgi:hypothetical protein
LVFIIETEYVYCAAGAESNSTKSEFLKGHAMAQFGFQQNQRINVILSAAAG